MATRDAVALVGAGSMGLGWAIVFARAGLDVRLYDAAPAMLEQARPAIAARLEELVRQKLLDGAPDDILPRVRVTADLAEALTGVVHVQENVPERVDLKRTLFADFDRLAPAEAVLASSTSSLPASSFTQDLPGRARCLVAHPANPPYLMPIVEIVPAPWTAPEVTERTRVLMERVKQAPVVLKREVNGFIYNRLQGAVLREAYWLLREGIADVAEIDRVMTSGLAMRWSVIGPFETSDLNYRGGLADHASRMAKRYHEMAEDLGTPEPWSDELVGEAVRQRRELLPLEDWEDRVGWRDRQLMAILRARREGDV